MNNDRLEKLRSLMATVNESITKQEFVTSFKAVLDFVKQIDAKNTAEFDNIKVQFKHLANSLKLANKDELDDLKAIVNNTLKDTMAEMMVECDAKMQAMDMKMSQMRDGIDGMDGKDADEKKVMEMVLAKMPPVESNEPLDIVEKLESLKGDYRLDAKAIKNLPESTGGRFGGGLSRGVADKLYAPIGTAGGAVDSVNGQTGVVVLDADDIDDATTTNKFVTAADITKLGNLSGTNTGDQDLSGYLTIANAASTYQPLDTQLTALAGLAYTGNGLKVVRVNAGENGFELATVSSGITLKTNSVDNGSQAVLNLIAGTNITLTDGGTGGITIDAAAGGGGISRTVVVTSGSATMGATANTDYTYYVAAAHTMSLPSPNTNRYTVKNLHSAAITIDTAGAENIEGAANISLQPNDSVDLMSDGTNWYVH